MTGMRALLALGVGLGYGWLAGWQNELMPVLLGAVASALAETDDNWRGRLRATVITLIAFVLLAAAVSVTWNHPVGLAAVLAISAFVLTMLGAISERYRAIAFGALVFCIYCALAAHEQPAPMWQTALTMLSGSVWFGCVSVLWAAAFPAPPVRYRLAQLYALLGEYLRLKANLLEPVRGADHERHRMALALHNGRVVEALNASKECLFSRMAEGQQPAWLHAAMNQYLIAQDVHERCSSSHEHYDLLAEAFFHSDALYRCQRMLMTLGEHSHKLAAAIRQQSEAPDQGETMRSLADMQAAIRHLERAASPGRAMDALRALADNLAAITGALVQLQLPAESGVDQSLWDRHPRTLRDAWMRVRAQMHPRSVLLRHSVRLSLSLMAGFTVMQLNGDPHGFWILLTIVFVSQLRYVDTLRKGSQRVVGTVLGLALGWALVRLFPEPVFHSILVLLAGAVFMGVRRTYYMIATIAVTTLLLSSFHQLGMSQGVIPARLLDTIVGSGIAWAAAWLLLPAWQARQWPALARQALSAQAQYLNEIISQYQGGKRDHLAYRLARRNAHNADAALSNAYTAMSKEPARARRHQASYGRFLLLSHTLLNYISAVGAQRGSPNASKTMDDAIRTAELVQQQLLAISLALGAWNPGAGAAAEEQERLGAGMQATEEGDQGQGQGQVLLHRQLKLALRLLPELEAQVRLITAGPKNIATMARAA